MKKNLLGGSALLLGASLIAGGYVLRSLTTNINGGLAGSASCRECHQISHDLWETSRHGNSMQPYSSGFAKTNILALERTIEIGVDGEQATIRPEKGIVVIAGNDGPKEFAISYAVGGKNVFYFLAKQDRGRLQTLPIAYDVGSKTWFNTAKSGVRHFGDSTRDAPLPWTHRAYTFNTSCNRCHVSQASSNYDVATGSYRSSWAEPGINCETCHGPAEEHVQTVRSIENITKETDLKIIRAKKFTVEQTNDMCGSCHAKMSTLTIAFMPGERYFDHFDLATLDDRDFYPDGRDLGENYTYTSWRLSPCVQSGEISCLHCHTSSGRFRFTSAPDNACLPCHSSLVQNPEPHTRHRQGVSGGLCIDCHMPTTTFARMKRSDHSMLPPTPASSLRFGSPNACTLCHTDKSAVWSDALVRKWSTRDFQKPVLHRAGLIDAARKQNWSRLDEMLLYVTGRNSVEIFVASLLRLMHTCNDNRKWAAIEKSLGSQSPLVRAAAAEALEGHATGRTLPLLAKEAGDPYRLVRIRAAAALAGHKGLALNRPEDSVVNAATAELISSLRSRPDDFSSYYNLGNFYQARQEFQQAIESYETAEMLEPDDAANLVNVALVYNALGRNEKAERNLRKAVALQPTNTAANLNLGLLLGEVGRLQEAEEALRAAFTSDTSCAPAAYNLAVIVADTRLEEAIAWSRKAVAIRPEERKYSDALVLFLQRRRDRK